MENKNKNIVTIEDISLIKIERKYNSGHKETYYYNLKVSDIDELLLIETNDPLPKDIIGSKFKFNKDKTEIIDFAIIM